MTVLSGNNEFQLHNTLPKNKNNENVTRQTPLTLESDYAEARTNYSYFYGFTRTLGLRLTSDFT